MTKNDNIDFKRYLKLCATLLFGLLAVLWAVEIVDTLLLGSLDRFGIRPRSARGLLGIVFAPFLHGGFAHLIGNSFGLLLFGGMLMLRDERDFIFVTVGGALLGGAGVWLFAGANENHIGFSGVVFAYFGFLVSVGFFERKIGSLVASLFIGVTWGSIVFGVLPVMPGVSWEGHLFGMLAGVFSAFVIGRKARQATT